MDVLWIYHGETVLVSNNETVRVRIATALFDFRSLGLDEAVHLVCINVLHVVRVDLHPRVLENIPS